MPYWLNNWATNPLFGWTPRLLAHLSALVRRSSGSPLTRWLQHASAVFTCEHLWILWFAFGLFSELWADNFGIFVMKAAGLACALSALTTTMPDRVRICGGHRQYVVCLGGGGIPGPFKLSDCNCIVTSKRHTAGPCPDICSAKSAVNTSRTWSRTRITYTVDANNMHNTFMYYLMQLTMFIITGTWNYLCDTLVQWTQSTTNI